MEKSGPPTPFSKCAGSPVVARATQASRDRAGQLKKSLEHFLPAELKPRCCFIAAAAKHYPVQQLCNALGVNRSTDYRRLQSRAESDDEAQARAVVRQVCLRHSRRYGVRRMEAELQAEGIDLGRQRIRRMRKAEGLQAIQPKRFVPKTTDSSHHMDYAENLLLGMKLPPERANEVIGGDIPYGPLQAGSFAYLATWTDLFSRLVIGWQVEANLQDSLVIATFEKALVRRGQLRAAIVHSDRGGQYASVRFRSLLQASRCRQSMSRAAESYDHAYAESLFSRYKAELLEGSAFADVEEARFETFNDIEGYYNRIRKHSSLGYLSPEEHERKYVAESDRKINEVLDNQTAKGVEAKTLLCRNF